MIAELRRVQFGCKSEKLDWQIEQLELKLDELEASWAQEATAPPVWPAVHGRREKSCRSKKLARTVAMQLIGRPAQSVSLSGRVVHARRAGLWLAPPSNEVHHQGMDRTAPCRSRKMLTTRKRRCVAMLSPTLQLSF